MKVAVVTGASSGIGRSAALQIARRGTGVILAYSSNEQGAKDTVARIEQHAVALPWRCPWISATRRDSLSSGRPLPRCCARPSSGTPSTTWSTTPDPPARR